MGTRERRRETLERRKSLYESGLSLRQVARLEGVTQQAIHGYLLHYGVKTRPLARRSEPLKLECASCKKEFYAPKFKRTCSNQCFRELRRAYRRDIGRNGKLSRAYHLYAENPDMPIKAAGREAGLSEKTNLHSALREWARSYDMPWPLRRKR